MPNVGLCHLNENSKAFPEKVAVLVAAHIALNPVNHLVFMVPSQPRTEMQLIIIINLNFFFYCALIKDVYK